MRQVDSDFVLLTWSASTRRTVLLDRFRFDGVPYEPAGGGSVFVAAVTPHGSVLAAV